MMRVMKRFCLTQTENTAQLVMSFFQPWKQYLAAVFSSETHKCSPAMEHLANDIFKERSAFTISKVLLLFFFPYSMLFFYKLTSKYNIKSGAICMSGLEFVCRSCK